MMQRKPKWQTELNTCKSESEDWVRYDGDGVAGRDVVMP